MPTLTPHTLGKFCRELAIGLSPVNTLCAEWGLSEPQFNALRESAGYKHEMTIIAQEIAELGADAGYIYRMKSISEEALSDIVKILSADDTPTSIKVDLIKFCADMARLKAPPVPKGGEMPGARGPTVVFQFGDGLPVKSMQVIEADIAPTPEAPRSIGFQLVPSDD